MKGVELRERGMTSVGFNRMVHLLTEGRQPGLQVGR